MKGFAYALEPHWIGKIENTMGSPEMAASERYRNLTILGLDEYAISGSELRKKRFPIKEKIGKPFTVTLPEKVNDEIESVKKKRNEIKKLTIRYLVLLGFEKWTKDKMLRSEGVKEEPVKENLVSVDVIEENLEDVGPKIVAAKKPYELWQKDSGRITSEELDALKITAAEPANDETDFIGKSNQDKFQLLMDLINEHDVKITIESNRK